MVDVGAKAISRRSATAEGVIRLQRATVLAIAKGQTPKGDVIAAARLAGIMAAKRTGELIPLCHPLPIESVNIQINLPKLGRFSATLVEIRLRATATITAKTGVEMEALTAVSVAALTIYDMCKAIDKTMRIDGIRLIEKTGGKSGDFVAGAFVPPSSQSATAPTTRSKPPRGRK
ncbi:MAG TPA: cyclic pyranopterin monophosphate synthase MoaC [Tepidisphaeraceae bacterium]|nr:cyclic pyranopterin monophosphate synthase MoaC [Tepidisphaeraceae bacterium]